MDTLSHFVPLNQFQFVPSMDRGPVKGLGVVEVTAKDFPSSQDAMVADLLQQAAVAGGVVEGQGGVVLSRNE